MLSYKFFIRRKWESTNLWLSENGEVYFWQTRVIPHLLSFNSFGTFSCVKTTVSDFTKI